MGRKPTEGTEGNKAEIKERGGGVKKVSKEDSEETRKASEEREEATQEDPVRELQDLRVQAEEAAKVIDNNTKKKADLLNAIVILRKKVEDVKKVVDGYGQALPGFKKEINEIECFSQSKTAHSEVAIKSRSDVVDTETNKVDSDIQKVNKKRDELKKEFNTARADYEQAKQILNEKQSEYDHLATLKQMIDNNLKELKSLKGSIERAEKEKKSAKAYFLNNELNGILRDTKSLMKDASKLPNNLYDAWNSLDLVKRDLMEKEGNCKTARSLFEKKQNECEGLRGNRRKTILKELMKIEKK